jgi:3-dehydroquinate dehydratase-2
MDDYSKQIQEYSSELGVEVDIFHSNIEGEVINKFYQAHEDGYDAAIINPAGYQSGYPALSAALTQVAFPTIEVHISNPAARGNVSQIAPSCKGVITGFGLFGYYIAIKAIVDMSDQKS